MVTADTSGGNATAISTQPPSASLKRKREDGTYDAGPRELQDSGVATAGAAVVEEAVVAASPLRNFQGLKDSRPPTPSNFCDSEPHFSMWFTEMQAHKSYTHEVALPKSFKLANDCPLPSFLPFTPTTKAELVYNTYFDSLKQYVRSDNDPEHLKTSSIFLCEAYGAYAESRLASEALLRLGPDRVVKFVFAELGHPPSPEDLKVDKARELADPQGPRTVHEPEYWIFPSKIGPNRVPKGDLMVAWAILLSELDRSILAGASRLNDAHFLEHPRRADRVIELPVFWVEYKKEPTNQAMHQLEMDLISSAKYLHYIGLVDITIWGLMVFRDGYNVLSVEITENMKGPVIVQHSPEILYFPFHSFFDFIKFFYVLADIRNLLRTQLKDRHVNARDFINKESWRVGHARFVDRQPGAKGGGAKKSGSKAPSAASSPAGPSGSPSIGGSQGGGYGRSGYNDVHSESGEVSEGESSIGSGGRAFAVLETPGGQETNDGVHVVVPSHFNTVSGAPHLEIQSPAPIRAYSVPGMIFHNGTDTQAGHARKPELLPDNLNIGSIHTF
ncbi:unnamed protein product [Peniophora sp. CBMAI 1063]|nr:unnamed protein product [Peniophora sp. CBMAI 1063]